MNPSVIIQELNDVTKVELVVEATSRDTFQGTQRLAGTLPHTFPYGKYRTLQHACAQCSQPVEVAFTYGKQILAGGDLSRQGFHEHKPLLDAVGTLFGLHLHHARDANGFESYLYLTTAPTPNEGALLDVAYYRCPHCEAQYLATYQVQLKDQRPPFEPDELRFERILQVALNHEEFMSAFTA